MVDSYSEEQAKSLHYIGIPFAIISILGSFLVFGIFYSMYGTDNNTSNIIKRFSSIKPIHEFVLLVALSNLTGSIGNLLGIGYPYQSNMALCKSREVLTVFGGLSSFLLSWIMSFIMYMTIFFSKNKLYVNLLINTKIRRIIEIVIFCLTFILSLSPLNILCTENAFEARLIFYIPMFITLIFISFCYLSIIYYFCKQETNGDDLRIYKNIRLYPGIMLFCLSWGGFRRLYQIATDGNEPPFGFAVLQIISMYSYGAFISSVFIYNVKLSKATEENDNDKINDGNNVENDQSNHKMVESELSNHLDTQQTSFMR